MWCKYAPAFWNILKLSSSLLFLSITTRYRYRYCPIVEMYVPGFRGIRDWPIYITKLGLVPLSVWKLSAFFFFFFFNERAKKIKRNTDKDQQKERQQSVQLFRCCVFGHSAVRSLYSSLFRLFLLEIVCILRVVILTTKGYPVIFALGSSCDSARQSLYQSQIADRVTDPCAWPHSARHCACQYLFYTLSLCCLGYSTHQ